MFSTQEQTPDKIFSTIIHYAVDGGASDIHIEPLENNTRIRYRVNGDLFNPIIFPLHFHDSVISYIKSLAKLNTQETRVPQSGKINFYTKIGGADFMVYFSPLVDRERAVLRFWEPSFAFGAVNVDFNEENEKAIMNALRDRRGVVLISGPKKSGKTATFYSILNSLLEEGDNNIFTIEDSVECFIDGVNQLETKDDIGFNSSSAFRVSLNNNPDVIGIKTTAEAGQVKNRETMELALRQADNRLIFFTLYADSAEDVICRVRNMGIDPRLLLSNLKLIINHDLENKSIVNFN